MAEEESGATGFKLLLDNREFLEKLFESKEHVNSFGEVSGPQELIQKLMKISGVIGVLGVAFLGFKTVVESVFDAEHIKKVNAQFEQLSENAGIAADALKESLVAGANGMAGEVDILTAANKALTELSVNAGQLGDVMNLARKATAVMGGDLIANFEAINSAIASGHARGLRHLGIIVDQDKAYREYAKSIGATVSSLSQAGRQQALMNAALEAGKSKFASVNPDLIGATVSWKQLKVTISEVQEIFVLAIDRMFGPSTRNAIKLFAGVINDLKGIALANLGNESQKASAHVKVLESSITDASKQMKLYQDMMASDHTGAAIKRGQASFEFQKKRLEELNAELDKFREKNAKILPKEEEGETKGKGTVAKDSVNDRIALEEKSKLEKELHALKAARIKADIALESDAAKMAELGLEEQKLVEADAGRKIEEIHRQVADAKIKDTKLAAQMISEIERERDDKLQELEEMEEERYLQSLERKVDESEDAADGIANAFKSGAAKNKAALTDWGETGRQQFDNFQANAGSALKAWGAGTKSAADAAKGFVFGMLSDTAAAQGKMMMASALLPPPNGTGAAGFIAGGAMLALSGLLGSLGGGHSSLGGGGGGATAATDTSGTTGFGTRTDTRPTLDQKQQKAVTIQIQGHYFDNDFANQKLVEMIRQSSDATSYTVQGVGT